MNKYHSTRTGKYHSKKESNRANELCIMERAGLISELREQVAYVLAPSVIINGRKKPALRYMADFVYVENGKTVVEDCKGFRDSVYKIKRHLMMAVHNITILET